MNPSPLARVFALTLALLTFRPAAVTADDTFGVAEPFKTGDIICFVGDSITHGGNYLSYINLFYATRFPDRKIQIWNCGVGGDSAAGIVSNEVFRLNTDILSHHPTVATIMLGMNDIGHGNYGPDKSGPEVEKLRQRSLEVYDENMRKLIAALQHSGARLILITPSIYDETTKLERAKPNVGVGRSAALAVCAGKVQGWATEYHTGLVKFQEEMNAVTTREQAQDPTFTIVGPDRVHPGAIGHFVMAYTFLKAQGMPRDVARIGIDAKKGTAADGSNCEITDIKTAPDGVEFDCLEKALPFVPTQETRPALALVPFDQELNQEPLIVAGLKLGQYALRIDGKVVGDYTSDELVSGVNLAPNEKTPQHQQSAAATKINYDRSQAVQHLRFIAGHLYTVSRRKVDLTDPAAVMKALAQRFEEEKAEGQHLDPVADEWLTDPDAPAKREAEVQKLTAALEKACQPQKHHFALTKIHDL